MSTTRDPFQNRSPFDELDYKRRERLLLAISTWALPALVPVVLVFGLMMIQSRSWQTIVVFLLTALMIPANLMVKRMAESNNANLGGYVLLLYFLVVVGVNGTLIDGLQNAIAPAYTVIILMAGMMLSIKGCYFVAGCAVLLWGGSWLFIEGGIVPVYVLTSPLASIGVMVIVIFAFIFTAIISLLATRDLRQALNDATYELVQANRQLEKASKLKSQFTARTSHELRTPLSAIIVFTDMALRKAYGPITPKQEDSLERVLYSARRLRVLIDDILDLSKIEAGQLQTYDAPFAINNIVESVQITAENAATLKNLSYSVEVSPDMPPYIIGDEQRLTQILINLTDNAIKFTDEGTVSVEIGPVDKFNWQMVVSDTGRGIHEENLSAIFEAFRQDTTEVQGTGLGLAISKSLVNIMKGDIELQSELGKGSSFKVILPLHVANSEN